MTIDAIRKKVSLVEGIQGMTLNERLYATGLMEIFDRAKSEDRELAKQILLALKVDERSIQRILK